MRLLQRIRRLSPKDFENMVYDILVRRGIGNLKWRTPGADGGRDIEGEWSAYDFSGSARTERWYVECKRQRSAVDWPTVHTKLAYAENHHADYLLIATTSSLSSPCRDQVSLWNKSQRRPLIREWEGVDLERLIQSDTLIQVKYGFASSRRSLELAALPLLTVVTRLMHQVYGEAHSNGVPSPAIEFAAAASEYASVWLAGAVSVNRATARFDLGRDLYEWVQWRGRTATSRWNPYAVRAVFSAIRFFSGIDRIQCQSVLVDGSEILRIRVGANAVQRATAVIDVLCSMANWEWRRTTNAVTFKVRVAR